MSIYAPPRIVPARGKNAGKCWLLHGCCSDGPMTYAEARVEMDLLRRHPIADEQYSDMERRGLGGRVVHFLPNQGTQP